MLRPESEWQSATKRLQISTTLSSSWNIRRGKLVLFRTPQISIVSEPRSFSSTRLSCPSPTALVHGWMAFAPKFEKFDCQVERANWTEFSQSLNKSCECVSRWKKTFRNWAVLLWCEDNRVKKARWRTLYYGCRQYFPPVVRKMCRIPCLQITSSKIWKSTSRCRHQNWCWTGLTCFSLFDRMPPAQKKT